MLLATHTYKNPESNAIVPANPFDDAVVGAVFETIKLADNVENGTVLTDALLAGLRSTNILSVLATLAAVGSSDIFLLLSAICIS